MNGTVYPYGVILFLSYFLCLFFRYQPKGIIKRNWILKHLHVLPAVIALFQDIEWNDPDWTGKQYQCLSAIQSIKSQIQVCI